MALSRVFKRLLAHSRAAVRESETGAQDAIDHEGAEASQPIQEAEAALSSAMVVNGELVFRVNQPSICAVFIGTVNVLGLKCIHHGATSAMASMNSNRPVSLKQTDLMSPLCSTPHLQLFSQQILISLDAKGEGEAW